MSNSKSKLLSSLKKTLVVSLPVVAVSGFIPTALTVDSALAESKSYTKVAAEAEGKAEGYASEAKGEAEGHASEAKGEAEGYASEAEAEAAEAEAEAE